MADDRQGETSRILQLLRKHVIFAIAILAGLLVFLLLTTREVNARNLLAGWNVSALLFIAATWRRMLRASVATIRKRSADLDFSARHSLSRSGVPVRDHQLSRRRVGGFVLEEDVVQLGGRRTVRFDVYLDAVAKTVRHRITSRAFRRWRSLHEKNRVASARQRVRAIQGDANRLHAARVEL